MHNYIKTLIAAIAVLSILISCNTTSNINEIEYSETEYMVGASDLDIEDGIALDTIPDPNPEEPENPEEEPSEEPEEEPIPIPDTIGVWIIK